MTHEVSRRNPNPSSRVFVWLCGRFLLDQLLYLRRVHILFRQQFDAGVDAAFGLFAVELVDNGLDAFVAHLEGVLEHERIDRAFADVLDQVGGGVEADQRDFAYEVALAHGPHGADCGRFVRREEAGQVGMRGEHVFGDPQGCHRVGLAVKDDRDDRDSRELFLNRVAEALLALVGRDRAFLDPEDGDFAFAAELLAHSLRRDGPALAVVGRNVREVILRRDARIEDRHRDAGGLRLVDHRHQRVAVRRGEHDAVNALVDHVLDDVDLFGISRFLSGAFPEDLDVEVLARSVRARFDRRPERVRNAFGNYGDGLLLGAPGAIAGGYEWRREERKSNDDDEFRFVHNI